MAVQSERTLGHAKITARSKRSPRLLRLTVAEQGGRFSDGLYYPGDRNHETSTHRWLKPRPPVSPTQTGIVRSANQETNKQNILTICRLKHLKEIQ